MKNEESVLNEEIDVQDAEILTVELSIKLENDKDFIDELERICEKFAINQEFFIKFS